MKFEYCKPVNAKSVPTGPNWIHEVQYDGYNRRIVRDGKDVKLLSKKLGLSLPVDRRDRVQDQGEPVHQRRGNLRARRAEYLRFRRAAFQPERPKKPSFTPSTRSHSVARISGI